MKVGEDQKKKKRAQREKKTERREGEQGTIEIDLGGRQQQGAVERQGEGERQQWTTTRRKNEIPMTGERENEKKRRERKKTREIKGKGERRYEARSVWPSEIIPLVIPRFNICSDSNIYL